ncbi:MAG: ParA family protein [Cyanothece sp. SIO1E1]|nr:ParA family protein [Cyanothece sp. SIO1E1]
MIIVIAAGKGGSCKSTTALAIAAILHKRRKKILVVDCDPQGSLSWVAESAEAQFDIAQEVDPMVLAQLGKLDDYDYIICDTPPKLSDDGLGTAVKLADYCILPTPTSPLDTRELPRTINQIIKPTKTPYRVLLARVDSRRAAEAIALQTKLSELDIPTFKAFIRNRVAHERAIIEGKLITQYKGSGAKDALTDYTKVVTELLKELRNA